MALQSSENKNQPARRSNSALRRRQTGLKREFQALRARVLIHLAPVREHTIPVRLPAPGVRADAVERARALVRPVLPLPPPVAAEHADPVDDHVCGGDFFSQR
jgi:hypothetical protein